MEALQVETIKNWPKPLRQGLAVGLVALVVQLLGFLVFSQVQAWHFNLEQDYSQFGQAWYLAAHLDFSSVVTIKSRPFYMDHGDFFLYALVPLWYLWPHAVTLMWVQDIFAVLAEAIALIWIHESIYESYKGRNFSTDLRMLSGFGTSLLVLNPFVFWAVANDFHTEIFATAFLVLAARSFSQKKRIAWLWVAGVILNGNVSASYLLGLTISMLLVGRSYWRAALMTAAVALASTEVATLIHADQGSSFRGYSYLVARGDSAPTSTSQVAQLILKNPIAALNNLIGYRLAAFVTISIPGLLGLMSPWALGVTVVCIAEAGFNAWPILTPSYAFQNFALFIFLPIGSVMVANKLLRSTKLWLRRSLQFLIALQMTWTFGWFLIWAPETPHRWISIPQTSARELSRAHELIPQGDQVIASQGVVGGFSLRKYVYMFEINANSGVVNFPIKTQTVWFVITPNLGIELQTPSSALAMASRIEQLPQVKTVIKRHGVFVMKWVPPDSVGSTFTLDFRDHPIDPSLLNIDGFGGSIDLNSRPGYVLSGYYKILTLTQLFQYSVKFKSDGPLIIEVWNTSTNELLRRIHTVATDNSFEEVVLRGQLTEIHGPRIWNGYWPFVSQVETSPYPGDTLELRIFNDGTTVCEIQSVDFESEYQSR